MEMSKDEILELVNSCAKGDEKSIQKFFEYFSQDIYNFPLKVFHLSEDDASDFFIYAFERLKDGKRLQSFKAKSSFKTWLYTVLRNMLIDWKRNRKELKIVSPSRINSDGVEYNTIENEADEGIETKAEAEIISEKFQSALNEIRIENRVLFKIAYIYYLNLDKEEIEYILEKTGHSLEELKKRIIKIRDDLSERELENIAKEDKITSLYRNIMELKEIKTKEPVPYFQDNLPKSDKIDSLIKKKYEQRRKLLDKRQKGHFLARTPYKEITELLKIPEGGISISLQRVVEKMQKKF